MSTDEITTADKITLLKHLVKGKDAEAVAAIMGMERYEVIDHAANHGYPHKDKMAKAIELLQAKNTPSVTQDRTVRPVPTPTPQRPPARAATPSRATARGTAAAPSRRDNFTAPMKLEQRSPQDTKMMWKDGRPASDDPAQAPEDRRSPAALLAAGKASPKKRTQALARRAQECLDKLDEVLEGERAEAEAARRAAEEVERLRQEKEKLEKKLAEVTAKLRGSSSRRTTKSTSTASGSTGTAKEIRAWAREEGLEVPDSGRVPQSICDAYAEAHAARAGEDKVA